jgi:hypothetical protein
VRTGDPDLARSSLATAEALELGDDEAAALAEEFEHVRTIVGR